MDIYTMNGIDRVSTHTISQRAARSHDSMGIFGLSKAEKERKRMKLESKLRIKEMQAAAKAQKKTDKSGSKAQKKTDKSGSKAWSREARARGREEKEYARAYDIQHRGRTDWVPLAEKALEVGAPIAGAAMGIPPAGMFGGVFGGGGGPSTGIAVSGFGKYPWALPVAGAALVAGVLYAVTR